MSEGQALPHFPQLSGSLLNDSGSTHCRWHSTNGGSHLGTHSKLTLPSGAHSGVGSLQRVSQSPQCEGESCGGRHSRGASASLWPSTGESKNPPSGSCPSPPMGAAALPLPASVGLLPPVWEAPPLACVVCPSPPTAFGSHEEPFLHSPPTTPPLPQAAGKAYARHRPSAMYLSGRIQLILQLLPPWSQRRVYRLRAAAQPIRARCRPVSGAAWPRGVAARRRDRARA